MMQRRRARDTFVSSETTTIKDGGVPLAAIEALVKIVVEQRGRIDAVETILREIAALKLGE